MKRFFLMIASVFLLGDLVGVASADVELSRQERRERYESLPAEYQEFLEDVSPIIVPEERDAFLRLETDDQRDVFIDAFWRRRDELNNVTDFRSIYYDRLAVVDMRFRHKDTDRGRIFMIRGEPSAIIDVEGCSYIYDVQIWQFGGIRDELLIFYRPVGDYRIWVPRPTRNQALEDLLNPSGAQAGKERVFYPWRDQDILRDPLITRCRNGPLLLQAIEDSDARGYDVYDEFVAPPLDQEELDRLLSTSVVPTPGARPLEASSETTYGGPRGTRTTVQVLVTVPASEVAPIEVDGTTFHRITLNGEVSRDGVMFENFQYRYDFPSVDQELLALGIERHLREGPYIMRLRVQDEGSDGEALLTMNLDVPPPVGPQGSSPEVVTMESSNSTIRLTERRAEEILTGFVNFEAITTDQVEQVEFLIDGESSGRKTRAPWKLSLDVGPVPRRHLIEARAYDEEGALIGSDRITINDGVDPFRMRIVSPRMTRGITGRTRVEIEPRAPIGTSVESIEIYLDEVLVATLLDAPWVAWIDFGPEERLHVIEAVARLDDPSVRPIEDVSIVNAEGPIEALDVRLIELPVTVFEDGHPVSGLDRSDFSLSDSSGPIEIERFETQRDLPLSVGLAIDTSASMEDRMPAVRDAAATFFANVLRPGDEAFLMAFGRLVWNPIGWTSNRDNLNYALASLRAESTTALYDGLIESLYQFEGRRGRKAIILISDGADNASRFDWEATLTYARRMSIPIYSLGLSIPKTQLLARNKLSRVAAETGGRSWFLEDLAELPAIYKVIEEELRTQYLLSFYASERDTSDWIELTVETRTGSVRAPAGYYP